MSVQFTSSLADTILTTLKTEIEIDPVVLRVRTGAPPASCSDADTGTLLAAVNLTSPIFNAPSSGSMTFTGTWEDLAADDTGTAGHWRLFTDGTCYAQGTCSASGGGGDLILSTTTFTAGQPFSITTWTWSLPV